MDSTSYIGSSTSLASSLATTANSDTANLRQFANLDLTESQRTQIRSIAQNAKTSNLSISQLQSQIGNVLTPQQQATLATDQSSMRAGGGHHRAFDGSVSAASSPSSASTTPLTMLEEDTESSQSASTVNGLTLEDLQNQAAAGDSLSQQQLANQLFSTLSTSD